MQEKRGNFTQSLTNVQLHPKFLCFSFQLLLHPFQDCHNFATLASSRHGNRPLAHNLSASHTKPWLL